MKIAQGEPWGYDFTVEGRIGPATPARPRSKRSLKAVTGYRWWIDNQSEPIVTVSVVADASGLIQIALTAAQTADFPALDRRGYFRQAVCQVTMTSGADVQRFQARVLVAAAA